MSDEGSSYGWEGTKHAGYESSIYSLLGRLAREPRGQGKRPTFTPPSPQICLAALLQVGYRGFVGESVINRLRASSVSLRRYKSEDNALLDGVERETPDPENVGAHPSSKERCCRRTDLPRRVFGDGAEGTHHDLVGPEPAASHSAFVRARPGGGSHGAEPRAEEEGGTEAVPESWDTVGAHDLFRTVDRSAVELWADGLHLELGCGRTVSRGRQREKMYVPFTCSMGVITEQTVQPAMDPASCPRRQIGRAHV